MSVSLFLHCFVIFSAVERSILTKFEIPIHQAMGMTTSVSYLYNELVWCVCLFVFANFCHFLSCLQVDFDEI